MMLLTVDWDIQLRQQFKDHTHKAGSGRKSKDGCPCQIYRIDARIKEINKLINERNKAREAKDFKRSDDIRKELSDKGVILEDTKDGTIWRKRG